ncbi:parallel beta-helix repeat protein [Saccharopolyspora erythraea NRRL 2338]|uniref:right-handed parallel beta-helix repeat-containing protein n=1 Tax=Saccharopolyspora erythraea TaxID=1836 RepID=UPI0003033393|nr:right-handed parallel beta-helix repeat-containing protein [Saccharopolyspora erythraea]PFG96184.1 parallel beta-helix repeat protein [Saccharopolyspora erythraea NRRL 2338]
MRHTLRPLPCLALAGLLLMSCAPAKQAGPAGGTPPARLAVTEYQAPPGSLFVATNGDDSAQGGETTPLRTLGEAVRRAPQGTTIVLREGTYRETVGLVGKKLTIQPYPRERVWLKGSRVISRWSASGNAWRHTDWDPPLCRTCYLPEIIDPAHPLAGLPDMVFVDGRPLRQVGERSAVTAGTFHVDVKRKELLIGDNPRGRLVEAAEFPWLLQFDGPEAAHSAIRGIGIAHYGSNQEYGQRGAMVVVNAPSVTLENNTFAASASTGAAVFQPDGTVKGNHFVDNGLVGLMANRADRLRLTGNTFARNNNEHFALSGEAIGAAGAKITRSKHPYVADNAFVDNFATGWWCDLGCTDAVVIRNLARGNAVNGIYYEVSARAIIASNTVVGNRARGIKISSSDRVRLHHNTMVGNAVALGIYNDPRSPSSDPYSEQLGLSWITSRTELVSNFFIGPNPFVESADHKPRPKPPAPFVSVSDGNAYLWQEGKGPLATWSLGRGEIVTINSLAHLQTTGHDRHSLQAPPAPDPFRDPGKGDYRLREKAPGYRAGRPLARDIAEVLGLAPNEHPDVGMLTGPRS